MKRTPVHCLVAPALAAFLALGCQTPPPETSDASRGPDDAAEIDATTPAAPATPASASGTPAAKALAADILASTDVTGGLIVHVGCGDGELTAALGAGESFIVHGLARSAAEVGAARKRIRALGLYGRVSVDLLADEALPYAENLVNLIVSEDLGEVTSAEVMRVLAPEGVAYIKADGEWRKTVKPRPAEIDEWTHYLHGPDGNPVAQDSVVGPPKRLQWVGSPRWSRHHDHMASMTSLVSAGGRLFYIFDEGPTASIQLPESWRLVARDAFNGAILWKRKIDRWNTRHYPLKSGPAHLLRRLVAVGERVYVTLGIDAPAAALDAATGETRLTFDDTRFTKEIVVSDGVVFLVAGKGPSKLPSWRRVSSYVWENTRTANPGWGWNLEPRRLLAHRAETGTRVWEKEFPVAPCSLAVDGERAVFHDGERLVCLDRATGEVRWRSEPCKTPLPVQTNTGPRVVLYKDVVLFAGNNKLIVGYSAADGRKLWEAAQRPTGHLSLKDLYVSGGLVWTAAIANSRDDGVFLGYDPRTGEKKREFKPDVHPHWFHHRCYPAKATEKYLITGRNGTEFVDTAAETWTPNHWVRGGCIFGVMPCNGMIYAPMHSCGCQLEAKLFGFNALASGPVPEPGAAALAGEARLERGPAYGKADGPAAVADDWPTYRRDPARSGATSAAVPGELGVVWSAKLGGRLSPPTIAGGKAFVSEIDAHAVHAVDVATGGVAWTYTAGARVDSPPTYHKGLVIFGSVDGRVYALRAADGMLAWRFRAAPVDRRIVAWEQLESAWPVHGSVLVHEAVVYCLAGRSIFLDGGIRFVKLEAATGKLLGEVVMDENDPASDRDMHAYVKGMNMAVGLSDVLSFDGKFLYMRSQKIDLEGRRHEIAVADLSDQGPDGQHMFCQVGFLDDSWFFRGYWTYGRRVSGGYGGWFQAGRLVPSGRILACDGSRVYGYGRTPAHMVNSSVLEHHLFAAEAAPSREAIANVRAANGRMNARSKHKNASSSDWRVLRAFPIQDQTAARYSWRLKQPSVMGRALAAAGDVLFAAGPPALADERRAYRTPDDPEVVARLAKQAEALTGALGGELWAVAKADGKAIARYKLDTIPVFDGIAVAGGRLFMSTVDGRVLCLGAGGKALAKVEDRPLSIGWPEPEDPDYLVPEPVKKDGDFDYVARGSQVFESKLGYALRSKRKERFGYAVNVLDKPLTKRVILKARYRPERTGGGVLLNGYLAFGDGTKDERLVKCGVRVQSRQLQIVQGPRKGGKSRAAQAKLGKDKAVDLTVTVDLGGRKVTLEAGGKQLTVDLALDMKAVTHVGFAVDSAFSAFSPVEVTGE